jgi:hypothetical protein
MPKPAVASRTSNLLIRAKGGVYGPMITPAIRYPSISGYFNRWARKVIAPATTMITAKSPTNSMPSDIMETSLI